MFHIYFSGRNPDHKFVKLMFDRYAATISVMAKDTEGVCVCACVSTHTHASVLY
jgi:hypothetical protein